MRVMPRSYAQNDGTKLAGVVLQVQSEAESNALDRVFGCQVGEDGLIGTLAVERRLADGYREDYLHIVQGRHVPADKLAGPSVTISAASYFALQEQISTLKAGRDYLQDLCAKLEANNGTLQKLIDQAEEAAQEKQKTIDRLVAEGARMADDVQRLTQQIADMAASQVAP